MRQKKRHKLQSRNIGITGKTVRQTDRQTDRQTYIDGYSCYSNVSNLPIRQ